MAETESTDYDADQLEDCQGAIDWLVVTIRERYKLDPAEHVVLISKRKLSSGMTRLSLDFEPCDA